MSRNETPNALRSIFLLSRALGDCYLWTGCKVDSSHLDLLPLGAFKDDIAPDSDLIDRGFMYAQFTYTGQRVIVRPRYNRRYLKAWGCYVTDFEAYEVDTVVNAEGTGIVAALGKKHPRIRRLYTNADILPGGAA